MTFGDLVEIIILTLKQYMCIFHTTSVIYQL